jgi:hypothetical protein
MKSAHSYGDENTIRATHVVFVIPDPPRANHNHLHLRNRGMALSMFPMMHYQAFA